MGLYLIHISKHVFDVNAVFTPNPKDGTLDVTLSTIDNKMCIRDRNSI